MADNNCSYDVTASDLLFTFYAGIVCFLDRKIKHAVMLLTVED